MKINNKPVSTGIILKIAGFVFGCGILYATFQLTTNKINRIEPLVTQHETEIQLLKAHLMYIKESVTRIEDKLK